MSNRDRNIRFLFNFIRFYSSKNQNVTRILERSFSPKKCEIFGGFLEFHQYFIHETFYNIFFGKIFWGNVRKRSNGQIAQIAINVRFKKIKIKQKILKKSRKFFSKVLGKSTKKFSNVFGKSRKKISKIFGDNKLKTSYEECCE